MAAVDMVLEGVLILVLHLAAVEDLGAEVDSVEAVVDLAQIMVMDLVNT